MAAEVDFEIAQGKTFTFAFRWASLPIKYVPIEAVPEVAPLRVTATGHGIPDGWPVAIVSTEGLDEVRAENNPPRTSAYHTATLVDADTVEFNAVNAADFPPRASITAIALSRFPTLADASSFSRPLRGLDASYRPGAPKASTWVRR